MGSSAAPPAAASGSVTHGRSPGLTAYCQRRLPGHFVQWREKCTGTPLTVAGAAADRRKKPAAFPFLPQCEAPCETQCSSFVEPCQTPRFCKRESGRGRGGGSRLLGPHR